MSWPCADLHPTDAQEGTLHQRAMRMELLAHTLAVLPLQSLDAPLYAIHHIASQVPMLGTIVLQGLDDLVRRRHGEDDDDTQGGDAEAPMAFTKGVEIDEAKGGGASSAHLHSEAGGARSAEAKDAEEQEVQRVGEEMGKTDGGVRRRPHWQPADDEQEARDREVLKALCSKGLAAAVMLKIWPFVFGIVQFERNAALLLLFPAPPPPPPPPPCRSNCTL